MEEVPRLYSNILKCLLIINIDLDALNECQTKYSTHAFPIIIFFPYRLRQTSEMRCKPAHRPVHMSVDDNAVFLSHIQRYEIRACPPDPKM